MMVYRFSNIRTELGFGTMPEENIVYSRKGGCFISMCKGVCITILLIIFVSLLLVIVFFSTKNSYQKYSGQTLEEYVSKPSPFIDKIDRIAKLFNPKAYRLVVQPMFNDPDDKTFKFNGTVYIVVAARRGNNKKIELNVKNLDIDESEVFVYKSFKIPNLKNENLFSAESNEKYLRVKRENDEIEVDNETTEESVITNDAEPSSNNSSLETEISASNETDLISILQPSDGVIVSSTPVSEQLPNKPSNDVIDPTKFVSTVNDNNNNNNNDDEEEEPDDDELEIKKINKIELDKDDEKLIISLDVELRRNIFYTIKVQFSGNMTTNRGLFYKTFNDSSGTLRYMAATYTTPENARLIFPCFDDDDFQSTFDLSIIRLDTMRSASNAPINKTEIYNHNKQLMIDNYEQTPPIPASELGFVVSDIGLKSIQITSNLSLQLFTQEQNTEKLDNTITSIQNIANILENYTNVPFNMNQLSYVIVPHRLNCREIKRGIIFTSESLIPISSADYLNHYEITHEMALQWFDGINQYELNEEIWLRSAFPLFLQQVTLSQINESTYFESLFVITKSEILRTEMGYYKFKLTRETDDDKLEEDIISLMKYKGLCILKMFNTSFSEDVFRSAIREYFRKRTHNQTVEFYTTLNDAAIATNSSIFHGINILQIFDQWINYEKFPVITVTKNQTTNTFMLTQKSLGFKEEKSHEVWHIPVTYVIGFDDDDRDVENRTLWMTNREQSLIHDEDEDFLLLNPTGIGYYRTNYDTKTWNYFIELLGTNYSYLTPTARSVLIDDAFNLARYGLLDYKIVFNLVTAIIIKNERTFVAWKVILDNFEFIVDNMPNSPEVVHLQEYIIVLLNQIYKPLTNGTTEDRKLFSDKNNNLYNLITKWACKMGNEICINQMREKLGVLMNHNTQPIEGITSKEELYSILCTVTTYGGFGEWIDIEDNFRETLYKIYPTVIMEALGCTREPSLIMKYIHLILSDDLNIQKYSNNILKAISENNIMFKYVMEFLFKNWKQIDARFTLKQMAIIFKQISSENDYNVLQKIFNKYFHTFIDRDKDTFKHILHSIKTTMKWKENFAKKITKEILFENTNLLRQKNKNFLFD